MRLRGKVALITGGAHGVGRATADTFAREGAKVVVADIDDETGTGAVEMIQAAGGLAHYLHLDVTDEESWIASIDELLSLFGRLDVLVNNAGISGSSEPNLTSTDFFDRLMLVNARSVFLGIKHGSHAMKLTGGGSIVNLSSVSARIGLRGVHIGYGASKAAVKSMTTTGAVHHAEDGIRVNAVAPGVLPPMQTARAGSRDPAMRAVQVDAIPMKRAGDVHEVANVVLFLASDESSYVTGTETVVDGGWNAV